MAVHLSEVPFGHDGALLAVLEEANDPAVGGPSALDVRLGSRSVQQLASAPRQVFCYDDLGASPAARGGNLAKIPPNQVIADFCRGSSVESESE